MTDDSDVFLFGGSRIYKNMFNQQKYVECYMAADIEREMRLDRGKLVQLAFYLAVIIQMGSQALVQWQLLKSWQNSHVMMIRISLIL